MNPEENPLEPSHNSPDDGFNRGREKGFAAGFKTGVEKRAGKKTESGGEGSAESKESKEPEESKEQKPPGKENPEMGEKNQGVPADDFEAGFESGFEDGIERAKKWGEQEQAKEEKEKKEKEEKDKDKEKEKKPLFKRPGFLIIAGIVLIVLVVGIVILWLILRQYVSTDDAYIDGFVTQVSPRAAAQVQALHVQDNQFVHKGDLLVELDPTDYQVALNQAAAQVAASEGQLKQAEAQVETAHAGVTQAVAEVDAAQVQLDNADRDLKRYQEVDERARSRQQLDNADTAQRNAAAQLKQAQARETSADANVRSSEASVASAEGQLETSKANRERAEVNLSYCKIFAPTDGRVTQRSVDVGNYVAVGQAMFILADPRVWVTANFKETQLAHMRSGQPVTIKVDAYPGTIWQGHVDSIQAGSGSRFSILPAENATGNYVKIVQRVPVKIVFDGPVNTNNDVLLSAGLSVIPRVKIR